MKARKILIVSILLMFFLNVNVLADDVPGTPHTFYGKVYQLGGSPAPAGLSLVAKINNTEYGSTTTSYGKYDYLIVTDPENKNNGQTIYFYVNGIQANPTYKFNSKTEGLTELDLTLTATLPTTTTTTPSVTGGGPTGGGPRATTTTTTVPVSACGNGKCESWETCSSCPEDCGECPRVNITIVSLIIPENVTANEPFILQVVVKNVGDIEGFDDITISIPTGWSTSIWGQRVTLKSSDAKTLYFTITPNEDSGKIAAGSSTGFLVSDTIYPLKPEGLRPMGITGFLALLSSLAYWWVGLIIVIILILIYLTRRKPSRKKPYEYKYKSKKK